MTCGDGVGFDVLSFDETDDSEQFIEVKTTGLGKHFPFYVTANEVRCSEDCPERFRLYRVFDFARNPRIYVVGGALSRECRPGARPVPGVDLTVDGSDRPVALGGVSSLSGRAAARRAPGDRPASWR